MSYWLVKQEPEEYSFGALQHDGKTAWTGVRNFEARNNLREMQVGDKVLVYHSGSEKAVVGLAEVSRAAFVDPTDESEKWIAVEIKPLASFAKSVSLAQIKAHAELQNMILIRRSRLSVTPLSESEFQNIISLAQN